MNNFKLAQNREVASLEKIVLSLSTFTEIEKIVFFGSRLRGDFDGFSDMDILIVMSNIHLKNKIIGILHDIELEFDVPISPVIFTSKEYKVNKELKSGFIENIEREGMILYDAKIKR